MELLELQDYFHDGSLLNIEHLGENIIISLTSSEVPCAIIKKNPSFLKKEYLLLFSCKE